MVFGVHSPPPQSKVTRGGPFPQWPKGKKLALTRDGWSLVNIILSDPQQAYSGIPNTQRGYCEAIFDTIILTLLCHSSSKHFFPKSERKSRYALLYKIYLAKDLQIFTRFTCALDFASGRNGMTDPAPITRKARNAEQFSSSSRIKYVQHDYCVCQQWPHLFQTARTETFQRKQCILQFTLVTLPLPLHYSCSRHTWNSREKSMCTIRSKVDPSPIWSHYILVGVGRRVRQGRYASGDPWVFRPTDPWNRNKGNYIINLH